MLLSLAQWLQGVSPDYGFFRVFQYLTFRAVLAESLQVWELNFCQLVVKVMTDQFLRSKVFRKILSGK